MLEIGDIVRVKDDVWLALFNKDNLYFSSSTGPVSWISPVGAHRIMIRGYGWQFKQDEVDFIYVDVDVSEFD